MAVLQYQTKLINSFLFNIEFEKTESISPSVFHYSRVGVRPTILHKVGHIPVTNFLIFTK